MYRSVFDAPRREMGGALDAVDAAIRSEDAFGVLPGPGRAQRANPLGGD